MPYFGSIDGTRLYYDVIGDEDLPPLVVLAGGPARHPEYLGDLAGLSTVRSLVVLHQRGVGRSEPSPEAETACWPELAEDVEALRDALGLERIALLGHSAGTRVALSYAARYPDRTERLCLVTPPATWLVPVPSDAAAIVESHRGEPWFDAFDTARTRFTDALSARDLIDLFPVIAPIGWARWDDTARAHEKIGAWNAEAQDLFSATVDAADLRARLAAVSGDVLVVAGEQDGVTGLAPVVALAEIFPAGRAAVIAGCGHYPWVEQPEEFSRVVREHLA
ncbi:alpha/beta fold hydrolase [Sanguibacter antarcticus]|uniref:Pimeloyl-ACP methyl ester carboxylesterase n=1 Tax=Sanguibacter antarcticus TaxID=372484 RepID=A0A2A9E9H4_9MICO|nr:alpha/beta hydrolase [Sanguibacter antarcticus]PFG35181.1 pimeloyl-ACP methyl ester carboxylesterase [Sanguibacter antarcticus]